MKFQLFNMPDGRRYCQVENGKQAPGQYDSLPPPPSGATHLHIFGESRFRRYSTAGTLDDGTKPTDAEVKESALRGFL